MGFLQNTSKVKKGDVFKALVIRTKRPLIEQKFNIHFKDNFVCLINKQGKPVCTRVFGPLPKQLKKNKWIKLASLSPGFI